MAESSKEYDIVFKKPTTQEAASQEAKLKLSEVTQEEAKLGRSLVSSPVDTIDGSDGLCGDSATRG